MVKDSYHPSKYFPSNIWRVCIHQNFALYGSLCSVSLMVEIICSTLHYYMPMVPYEQVWEILIFKNIVCIGRQSEVDAVWWTQDIALTHVFSCNIWVDRATCSNLCKIWALPWFILNSCNFQAYSKKVLKFTQLPKLLHWLKCYMLHRMTGSLTAMCISDQYCTYNINIIPPYS